MHRAISFWALLFVLLDALIEFVLGIVKNRRDAIKSHRFRTISLDMRLMVHRKPKDCLPRDLIRHLNCKWCLSPCWWPFLSQDLSQTRFWSAIEDINIKPAAKHDIRPLESEINVFLSPLGTFRYLPVLLRIILMIRSGQIFMVVSFRVFLSSILVTININFTAFPSRRHIW